jgi:hypothetical protein
VQEEILEEEQHFSLTVPQYEAPARVCQAKIPINEVEERIEELYKSNFDPKKEVRMYDFVITVIDAGTVSVTVSLIL